MKLPRLLVPFILSKTTAAGCVVKTGYTRWLVYLSRGVRYVVIRATRMDRPWECHRFSGTTDSWDRGTYAEREDFIVAFLRKLQRPSQGAVDKPDAHDPEMAGKFPALHEHLTRTRDDEGKPRQTCSLTVYGVKEGFKAFLNDRDSGASLGVTSDSLAGLLRALEAELESDAPSWFWREGSQERSKGGRGKRA